MIKSSTFLFTCVAIATGIALFHIKYQVITLEKEYNQTHNRIYETQEAIHVLRAEWAHLNNPHRLHTLCEKYLKISPIQASQFIPMRKLAQNAKDYDQYALNQLISEVSDIAKHGQATQSLPTYTQRRKKMEPTEKPKRHIRTKSDPIGDLIEQNIHTISTTHISRHLNVERCV